MNCAKISNIIASETGKVSVTDMKVLVLGDSITKGIIYDDDKGKYVASNKSFVNRFKNEDENLEIENVSLMGSTVSKGMKMLDRIGDEISSYEYTFIEFGGNDCNYMWPEISESPETVHECATPLESFKKIYTQLIDKIRSLGSKPVIVSLPPIVSSKFYQWIIKGLNEENISSFLGDKERLSRWQQYYNLAVSEIARLMKVPFIDITSPFFSSSNFSSLYCTDGIHPNEQGHELIYNSLKERLNSYKAANVIA